MGACGGLVRMQPGGPCDGQCTHCGPYGPVTVGCRPVVQVS